MVYLGAVVVSIVTQGLEWRRYTPVSKMWIC